ncbi:MAG: PilZ domain-containing protein [Lachnospiraceae bacterium]|nr:PilZ domain-containing protein [Lachnospiraceae bacterium]
MVLKDCSRCMVYTPKGKPFGEAAVTHTRDYVSLYFDLYEMRDMRMFTTVDFYDDRVGLVRAVCELVIHRNPSFPDIPHPWMANCVIKEVKDVLQRQRDIRAKVHIETRFESEHHGSFYGTITNLSAGGLYVEAGQPLNRDERISFEYNFRSVSRTFHARTIRAKRLGDIKYGYGCSFMGLSDNAEASIREYVYRVLKERDKGKR